MFTLKRVLVLRVYCTFVNDLQNQTAFGRQAGEDYICSILDYNGTKTIYS